MMVGRSDGAFCFLSKRGVLLDSGKKVPRRPRASGEGEQDATITSTRLYRDESKEASRLPRGQIDFAQRHFDPHLHLSSYYKQLMRARQAPRIPSLRPDNLFILHESLT